MPNFTSPALYIDFSRLAPPQVIEEINYEALLAAYRQQVVAKNPNLAKAVTLEQSPTNIILEAEAYGEMMVRARINAGARAVMLPFATGTDLDVLGAFYNVERLTGESDANFRRRIQLAPEAFSTAGTAGSYIFHALSVDPTFKDVAAYSPGPGKVTVVIMAGNQTGVPTDTQVQLVRERLLQKNIKPLTDVVTVLPVKPISVTFTAQATLFAGPDANLVLNDINAALTTAVTTDAKIGRGLNRPTLYAACVQSGVQDVTILSPTTDVAAGPDQFVRVDTANVTINPIRIDQ